MRKEIGNSGTPERPSASRRDFLQTLIVAASSAGLAAAGCQPTQTMTTTDVPVDPTPPTPAPYGDGKIFFPQSVASGDPKLDSVVLWTRAHDIAGFNIRTEAEQQIILPQTPRSACNSTRIFAE